ncbi:hypothetical protein FWF74_03655 [Candidatus Saccharibacteria bacterium]|nr:hypothetical protein [Candidatus Saccharibacteria bacterium]MCL1962870.1 hypothetical protein [Candidatus Saccharibacteria bacterium]
MKITFACVSLYIDRDETIYAIPCGWDRVTQKTVVGVSDVDLLFILKQPYTDDDIEAFLHNAIENCYKKEREPGPGALEKHFGFKSWVRATRGLKYIYFSFVKKEGYRLRASVKTPHRGYTMPQNNWIYMDLNPQKGELAVAFRKALAESKLDEPIPNPNPSERSKPKSK